MNICAFLLEMISLGGREVPYYIRAGFFWDGRLTMGDCNYRGWRFRAREGVGQEKEKGSNGCGGRVCGVGVVLVEMAGRLLAWKMKAGGDHLLWGGAAGTGGCYMLEQCYHTCMAFLNS